ncbi:MAG: sulfatase-like hydrolase/transferase, partial [Planctomycetota bacterium]
DIHLGVRGSGHAETYRRYAVDELPLPASAADDLHDKPNIYRRSARTYRDLSLREHREALACYYASITEIDACFGRLLERVEAAGQLQDTIVLLCADHGDLMGAHGLWTKNFGAFEEVYRIPLVFAGPGIASGATCAGRMGLQDLGPTLCTLADAAAMPATDGSDRSHLLRSPADLQEADRVGYAEYFGGRYILSQRIHWRDDWKYVFNGFDWDELYDLAADPDEMCNRIEDPDCRETAEDLMRSIWRIIEDSGDHSLGRSAYPPLRLGIVGMRA